MKENNETTKTSYTFAGRWPIAGALAGLMQFSGMAWAWDVSGVWNVTVQTRTDVVPIRAPGLIPDHTVSIADDTYSFYDDGSFSTYGIDGGWTQNKSQYTVVTNAMDLENQFRDSLKQSEPGIVINQLKLLSRKISGNELDNGIWGIEKYEYKIDSEFDGYRDVIRLVITSNVAGYPQVEEAAAAGMKQLAKSSAQRSDVASKRSPAIDAAVNAVVEHMKRRGAQAQ